MEERHMTRAHRIAGVAIIVVSAIMLALMLAGIVGAWVGRAVVNAELREVTTAIDSQMARLDSRAANVEGRVNDALQRTQGIRDRLQAFANRPLEDTVLNALAAQVLEELSPAIERATDAVDAVVGTVDNINQLARVTNRLTGADLPTFTLADDLPGLTQGVANARARVADLQTRVRDRRTEVRQDLAAEGARLTMAVDAALQPVLRVTTGVRTRLAAGQERVLAIPDRVDRTILLPAAIITTLVLGWLGFSQVALGWLGWLLFRGRLPGLAATPAAATAATPVVATAAAATASPAATTAATDEADAPPTEPDAPPTEPDAPPTEPDAPPDARAAEPPPS
jgi:hypothetical protein